MDMVELYRDIAQRTNGDIYVGVVGPVRTGKSTFIKRFLDLLVLPSIENEYSKERLKDELPQSAAGKTIMTTQPKFVPNEAVELVLDETADMRVRMVDCVGYMIDGASGHMEDGEPRMVRTPWFDYDIPFTDAAEIGTRRVISEHSTIGIVITTDGSIVDIEREKYIEAEDRVISELIECGKPFVTIVNSKDPEGELALSVANEISEKHGITVKTLDVLNMQPNQILELLEDVLFEFPIRTVLVEIPDWMRALNREHWLYKKVMDIVLNIAPSLNAMKDYRYIFEALNGIEGFEGAAIKSVELGTGNIIIKLIPTSELFYEVLGNECGCDIKNDFELMKNLKEFVAAKREYDYISSALECAKRTGYGVVSPQMDEMQLDEPEIVKQGSRFGVKLRARASGMHLIRVDLESEISPLVGTLEQSEEFMNYLVETFEKEPTKIWETNIFGKPLFDLVREGMTSKVVNGLPTEVQQKLQNTVEKMVNEGCNSLVCVLL
ncbi:MAG: stage IV sporulation protein A [Clostridia bacterium]|nr:stage IV sporulation protein A [Clostridia bacterium]